MRRKTRAAEPHAGSVCYTLTSMTLKPLWRNLSFTLMWTSTAASGFGDRMIMLAALALLGGMIAGVDSTSTQASTQFWFFLPYLVFSIVGGWLADHLPRKWVLLACDELRGVILLVSCLLASQVSGSAAIDRDAIWLTLPVLDLELPEYWKVYGALFAIGTLASIFNPTRNAIILVINVIASQIGLLIGKRIISQVDGSTVQTGLLLGAAFYLVSGTFFAFLKPVESHVATTTAPANRSLRQAAIYLARHRRVIVLIGLNILVWPSAAVVTSALFGLGKMHYDLSGDALLGHFANLSVALGVGMLIGAAVVSLIRTRRESPMVYMTALGVAGMGILLLAAVPWLPAAYAACLLIGIAGNVAIVSILTLLQSITPNYVRGRIMGLNTLLNTAFSVATYFAIWQLHDADRNIVYVMFALGPALTGIGAVGLIRYMMQGPMHTRAANFFWHLNRLFSLAWHGLQWFDRHHIPHRGPVVLASNHTTGLDPMLLQASSPRMIRWLMLTSYRFPLAAPLWRSIKPITLDRDGKDLAKIRAIVAVLREGHVVGMFPEGGLQRTHRELQSFEPGVAMVAKRTGALIVPAWISGTPKRRNMLWHLLQPSRSRVRFGEPFAVEKGQDNEQIMDELRQRLQRLAEE